MLNEKENNNFLGKYRIVYELLMITLKTEDLDSQTRAITGCSLVLTGHKLALVRGGHRGIVEQRREPLM
jgi:hypothetical protein